MRSPRSHRLDGTGDQREGMTVMTRSRARQWVCAFAGSAMVAACVTNQLTGTCFDNATCPDRAPPGPADADGDVVARDPEGPPRDCPGIDLRADPNNCGTCGHSCFGGPCAGGTCLPVKMAAIPGANGLALAHGGVVVTVMDFVEQGRGVFYVPPDLDGGIVQLGTDRAYSPSSDGVHACWVAEHGVPYSLPDGGQTCCVIAQHISCSLLDGGSRVSMYDDASPYPHPGSPLIHDGYVYWFTNRDKGTLQRASLSGDASTTTLGVIDDRAVYNVVLDGDRLFWLAYPRDGAMLATASLDDGSVTEARDVARLEIPMIWAFAVAGNVGYVAAGDNQNDKTKGGIYRIPMDADGGAATPLLRQSLGSSRLAIDKSHIYYTDGSRGILYRIPIPTSIPDGGFVPGMDGGQEAIVHGQDDLRDIRVDDRFVYWLSIATSGRQGEERRDYLMRMAK
ncbi:hypothetical protein [Pendulispora albinea]|uniref:DUF5050 domain-containing protein n=1 Tax=Pendulispora albinea TaxID=2741071 RepID=A0ABZ2M6X1_9BACT